MYILYYLMNLTKDEKKNTFSVEKWLEKVTGKINGKRKKTQLYQALPVPETTFSGAGIWSNHFWKDSQVEKYFFTIKP